MTNEYLYCKGQLEEKLVSRVQEYHGRWFLIENVPALVCRQCGEVFYMPQTYSLILRLVRDAQTPVRIEPLLVLNASSKAASDRFSRRLALNLARAG